MVTLCVSLFATDGPLRVKNDQGREKKREQEMRKKIVEVEFFDHGSISTLYVIDHVKRQEAINVLSSSSTLD